MTLEREVKGHFYKEVKFEQKQSKDRLVPFIKDSPPPPSFCLLSVS